MRLLLNSLLCLFLPFSFFGQSPCNNETSITHQGYEYDIVEIGEQCWFAENCKYLPSVSPPNEGSNTEPYYYVFGYEGNNVTAAQYAENYEIYGVLYNWPAVMTEGICPIGWHIPTDEEFTELTDFLGGESAAGGKMKEVGYDHWSPPNTGATNSSDWSGLPGGVRFGTGFYNFGIGGIWWSSSEDDSNAFQKSWRRSLDNQSAQIFREANSQSWSFSARCVINQLPIVQIPGCTVPTASNYDEEATEDDGSCTFNNSCNVDGIEVATSNYTYSPTDLSVEVGTLVTWSNTDGYHNVNGDMNTLTGESFGNPEVFFIDAVSGDETGVCLGSHVFNVAGIYSYDCSIGNHAEQGMVATITVGTGGCMDEGALNYNEAAEFDDGFCEYTINGCTNELACNYNPDATDDDGTCIIDIDCSGICGGNSFIDDCEECNATSVVSAGLSYPVSMTDQCESYPISPMYVISVTAVIGASTNTSSNAWVYLQDLSPLNLGSVSATPYNFEITTVTEDFETPIYVSQIGVCSWWNPSSLISLEFTGAEGCVIVIDPGCTDMEACNYNQEANLNDDSCVYDGDACDDGSEFTENDTYTAECECLGDAIETCEDGIQNQDETGIDCGGAFCDACPPPPCDGTFVTLTLYDQYSDGGGTVSVNGEDFLVNVGTNANPTSATYCVDLTTCIEVIYAANDNWPDENSWEITDAITDELLASGGNASGTFGACVPGCTEMEACNYNQGANLNDDSCLYAGDTCDDGNELTENDTYTADCECFGDEVEIVPGCTDETACNYNPEANQNDMSCLLPGDACDDNEVSTGNDAYNDECECEGEPLQGGCTYPDACNFDSEAEFENNTCLYVGDPCDDEDPNTEDDEILEDCDCTGTPITIVDELDALSVLIYPNPTSNSLTVDLGDLNGFITTIKLYDASSKLVFDHQSSSTLMIDVSGFAKGMYLLELTTEDQVLRSQVIFE
jgi:uncharacterized protein (TIGR02145 family)